MANKTLDGFFTSGGDIIKVKAIDNGDDTYSIATAKGTAGRSAQVEGQADNLPNGEGDVWQGNKDSIPLPNPLGQQMEVFSSSANDTLLGANAREVAIEYIDVDGYAQTEFLELNGTTAVQTVATNIIMVNDFYVTKNGDGTFNNKTTADGDICICEIGDNSLMYNVIKAGGNKSLSTLRMIPKGTAYNIDVVIVSGDTKGVTIIFRTNQSDTDVDTDGFLFRIPITIGDSPAPINMPTPIRIEEGRIFKATAFTPQGSSGGTVSYLIGGRLDTIV